jgi:hypothetical protein
VPDLAVEFGAARHWRRVRRGNSFHADQRFGKPRVGRIFGLLAEDLAEREVREALGHNLLELLQADYYASYVWQADARRFDHVVHLNMDPKNLANYAAYYQYHDPSPSSSRRGASRPW